MLLGRALMGDPAAAEVLRRERERWREALRPKFNSAEETEATLFILVGGALDVMLAE